MKKSPTFRQKIKDFQQLNHTLTPPPHPTHQGIPLDTDTKSAYDVASSTTSASNDCRLRCAAEVRRVDLCSNDKTTEVLKPMVTFWCYLLVRVLNGLTLGEDLVTSLWRM